jgi:hypothetical protein
VVALVFYGIVVIEGMLMRIYEIEPVLLTGKDLQERCC